MSNDNDKKTAVIQAGSRVSLHFALSLAGGELVDSNFDGQPAELTVGDGNLPAGFEKHLLGLEAGSHTSFTIPPEDSFGQQNPSNIQRIKRSQFTQDMALAEGLVIGFADASGTEVPGVIASFDEDWVTVDFNHPLAGKTLTFEVLVVAIK